MRPRFRPAPSRSRLLAVIAAVVIALCGATATAQEPGSIENIESRLDTARATLAELNQRFAQATRLEAEFELELRLQQGLVMLELGDPDRAAVMFLDIISREEWAGKPGYEQARFLLAQALYDSGHYATARERLLEVIKTARPETWQSAVALLIEVGIATDDWTGIDEVFAELERSGTVEARPELLYARGKGLYAEGRHQEALAMLQRVDLASPVGLKARYFTGVVNVRLGNIDSALTNFIAVIDQSRGMEQLDAEQREVVELAWMARARVHYEREEFTEAIDSYQYVPRNSRHFDQALYEVTWTHVRQGEIGLALRNLDIMLVAVPDSLFAPDALRLRADLLKDIGDFDNAQVGYQVLLDDFEPVLTELDAMVTGQNDQLAYFQQLVAEDDFGRTQYLPRSAARWVRPDEDMSEAGEMVGSLGSANDNMDESHALIEEIEAAISSEHRYEIFPQVRGAWTASLEYETNLLGLMRDLNNLEAEHLGMSSRGAAFDERRRAEEAYAELPQSRSAYENRERALKIALEERRLRAYRLRVQIEGAQAQIEAIERWVLLESSRAGLSQAEEQSLRADLAAARAEVDELTASLRQVERDLRVQSSLGGIDEGIVASEAETRETYKLALLREKEALAQQRGGRSDEVLQRIDRARETLRELDANVQTYRSQIKAVVNARVEDVRERLQTETVLLDEYAGRYDALQGDVKLVAGEIAWQHWKDTRQLFDDLVLTADVGVVDVAWLKKDRKSRHVDDLIETRNKEREILQQDFEQVLRELGQDTEP